MKLILKTKNPAAKFSLIRSVHLKDRTFFYKIRAGQSILMLKTLSG